MNVYVQMLFIFGAGAFLTWWFLLGLLNPFINASLAIIKCALEVILTFFFSCISALSNEIERRITLPIRRIKQRIHIHPLIKAGFYLTIGFSVFVLDHFYATKIYAEDETKFYDFVIGGNKYWVTEEALSIGGFFIFIGSLYLVGVVLRALNQLLDHPIRISIVLQK